MDDDQLWSGAAIPAQPDAAGGTDGASTDALAATAASGASDPIEPPTRAGPRRRRLGVTAGAGLAVVALIVALALVSGSTPGAAPTAAAAATVRHAVVATVEKGSMAFTLGEHEAVDGEAIAISGTGACSITHGTCVLAIRASTPLSPEALSLHELVTPSAVYAKFGPPIAAHLPTPWVSLPISARRLEQAAGGSTLSTNPLSGLAALAREGAKVTDLGASSVDGTSATKFSVQLSSQALSANSSKVEAALPAWMRSSSALSFGASTEDVWIAGGRLRQLTATATAQAAGHTVTVSVTLSVTGYGARIDVTVPPANEVTPFQQLSTSLGA